MPSNSLPYPGDNSHAERQIAKRRTPVWCVRSYTPSGRFASTIAGLNRKAGPLATEHTKSAARNYAWKLNTDPDRLFTYKAEPA